MKYPWLLALSLFTFCYSETSTKPKTIGIVVLGPAFQQGTLDSIQQALRTEYCVSTIVLESVSMPKHAFVSLKSSRYRADTLLRFLHQFKSDTISHIMGLTHLDISCTSRDKNGQVQKPVWKYQDWGIFGYAGRPGFTSIVSDYRLGKSNSKLCMERIQKVCLHEFGHNLGLPHCKNSSCLMRDAVEKRSTIDEESSNLCLTCRQKLN